MISRMSGMRVLRKKQNVDQGSEEWTLASQARERISIIAPVFPWLPSGGARTYYEHANGLARRGYQVSVVHSRNLRSGISGRLDYIARDQLSRARAGVLRRRISWMEIDPRVETVCVERLDEFTQLPPADLRVGTFWRTSEFLGRRAPDGARMMQLIQAYETFAGPAARVDATWQLPAPMAVVSRSLCRKARELGVPEALIHYVPNGLDHSIFHPIHPVDRRPPTVAFLAMEPPVKGLTDAIEVVRRVHRVRPDATFIAFGGLSRPRALPPFVRYVRGQSGQELVERVYDRSSIFLCTSRSEGFGFPSLEAMACGAALVSTRNGGVDDFASHGESALLRDVGDVEGLAAAVCTLLSDTDGRAALVESGLRAAAQFTWKASVDAFEGVVRACLDSAKAQAR